MRRYTTSARTGNTHARRTRVNPLGKAAGPAALNCASALPELSSAEVHLVFENDRKVKVPPGTVLHRSRDVSARVNRHRSPVRVRPEHAILDHMSEKLAADDIAGAFHALTEVAHSRRITADQMLDALAVRRRQRGWPGSFQRCRRCTPGQSRMGSTRSTR